MRSNILIPIAALLALLLIVAAIGGAAFQPDIQTVARLGLMRIAHPTIAAVLIWLTQLGGSFVLVPLTLIVAGWLIVVKRRRDGLLLLASTMSGRAMIELIKFMIDRPRPTLEPYPVFVSSQSFPSGHAGNSTITYLALALFALPERWRRQGLVGAAVLALLIGATRPALGVHWPTDVIGGWSFGALWMMLWSRVSRRE